jgi:hypothetical protein
MNALEQIGEEAPEGSSKARLTEMAIGLTFGTGILVATAAWAYFLGHLLVRAITWALS